MATQNNLIPGKGYQNVYIDSLIWGCGWDLSSASITYSFGEGAPSTDHQSIDPFIGKDWTPTEQNAFRLALNEYASVCNLSFTEINSPASSNITWWLVPESAIGYGTLGLHEVPDQTNNSIFGYFNYQDSTWSNLVVGSYGFETIIHELGHALGLAHPHDGGDHRDATIFPGVKGPWSTGTNALNQGIWTVMSYNSGWNKVPTFSTDFGYDGTPMAFDIAALQKIYGINTFTAIGNDCYYLPTTLASSTYWSCIWDASGTDTISNANSTLNATINLNAAPLTGANAGGFVSSVANIPGGFTIANGVVIENAIGGFGNDSIIGNAYNNILDGGAGTDTLVGGAGNDTYLVDIITATGALQDTLTEAASAGTDTIQLRGTYSGALANITLATNFENLDINNTGSSLYNLTGNTANNILTGNAADNTLNGGTGTDTLIGGLGNDTYVVDSTTDTITENASAGTDLVQSSVTFSLASITNVENLTLTGTSAINGTGNTLNNTLTGNTGVNTLSGGDGNDTLYGGLGNDTLTGGAGADHFVFNTTLNSSSNKDTITDFVSGTDKIELENSVMTALGLTTGTLNTDQFWAGAGVVKGHDATDRIVYNTTTGALYYDADGSGSGAAVQFAILGASIHPTISYQDLLVV